MEVLRICKCNDLHETFCRVQETIDRLGAWLVICIEMHVLLSEWRNETCASPIDFTAMKRALLGFGFENLWECMCDGKMEIEIGRHRRL